MSPCHSCPREQHCVSWLSPCPQAGLSLYPNSHRFPRTWLSPCPDSPRHQGWLSPHPCHLEPPACGCPHTLGHSCPRVPAVHVSHIPSVPPQGVTVPLPPGVAVTHPRAQLSPCPPTLTFLHSRVPLSPQPIHPRVPAVPIPGYGCPCPAICLSPSPTHPHLRVPPVPACPPRPVSAVHRSRSPLASSQSKIKLSPPRPCPHGEGMKRGVPVTANLPATVAVLGASRPVPE